MHFLTLIIVLVEQIISKSLTGSFAVYPFNDLYHFVLNIFFLSNWGFEHGLSFNAPVWSVSIEVFLYILFFLVALAGGARSMVFTVLIVLGSFFIPNLPRTMTNGIFCFFMGGGIFLIYQKLIKFNLKLLCWVTGLTAAVLWLITIITFKHDLAAHYDKILPDVFYLHRTIDLTVIYFSSGILFPVTILFLALVETYRGAFGSKNRIYWRHLLFDLFMAFPPTTFLHVTGTVFTFWSKIFFRPQVLCLFLCGIVEHFFS